MKKLLIISIVLLTLCSCIKTHNKASRCSEILNQRNNVLNKYIIYEELIDKTDSLYIQSGCDTIQ
jgi:hypothetical protein